MTKSILLLAALLLTASVQADDQRMTNTLPLDGVTHILVSGNTRVVLRQSDRESVTATATAKQLAQLDVRVSGNRLLLATRKKRGFFNWLTRCRNCAPVSFELQLANPARVELNGTYVARLETLDVADFVLEANGGGRIELGTVTADTLELRVNGAAEVGIGALQVTEIRFSGAGAAEVNVLETGNTDTLTVALSGAGSFRADALQTRRAELDLSGAADAIIRVSDELNVRSSGASSVRYHGDPTVTRQSSGAASIEKIN